HHHPEQGRPDSRQDPRDAPEHRAVPVSVVRVMGAETEYGIHAPGAGQFNATWLSTQVVNAYSKSTAHRASAGGETRWDYTDEDPLADARGWSYPRSSAHPSQLTD